MEREGGVTSPAWYRINVNKCFNGISNHRYGDGVLEAESHDYSCFEMAFLYKFLKKQTSRERYVSNITQWRLAEKILKSDFSSNKSSCNALNTLYLEKKHNFPIDLVKTFRALILWACYALRFLLITLAPKVLLEDL